MAFPEAVMATSSNGRSGIAYRAARATHELRKAEHLETRPAFGPTDALFKTREAEAARKEADRLLTPPKDLIGSAETELVPAIEPGEASPAIRLSMVCTLADPNTIAVDASEQRAMAATRVGVLSPAMDAIVTANAKNSIEKMLCHQLAAVHDAGMELLIRVRETALMGQLPVAEIVRLTNGAARLFDTYQTGCLTLQKMKTGGKQHVVVQHQQLVNVSNGGQAVVAAKVSRGGSRKEGGQRRNGE